MLTHNKRRHPEFISGSIEKLNQVQLDESEDFRQE